MVAWIKTLLVTKSSVKRHAKSLVLLGFVATTVDSRIIINNNDFSFVQLSFYIAGQAAEEGSRHGILRKTTATIVLAFQCLVGCIASDSPGAYTVLVLPEYL